RPSDLAAALRQLRRLAARQRAGDRAEVPAAQGLRRRDRDEHAGKPRLDQLAPRKRLKVAPGRESCEAGCGAAVPALSHWKTGGDCRWAVTAAGGPSCAACWRWCWRSPPSPPSTWPVLIRTFLS